MRKSKSLLTTLICIFSLTVLFAASKEIEVYGKFWGSSTECGPCSPYNGQPGSQGVQICTTTYYVLWIPISEQTSPPQNCTAL